MTSKPNHERLLSRDEVQEVFGISRRFLEAAAGRGDGPTMIRIGRSVRYRVKDLETWLDACAVAGERGGHR